MPSASIVYASYVGQQLGRLKVIKYLPRCRREGKPPRFVCQCVCRRQKEILASNLLRKGTGTRSCGCLAADASSDRLRTHGASRSPEWLAWKNMRDRCYNSGNRAYHNYGARGITVCRRWRESFMNFYADMGARPSSAHMLEREDNNGNYCPSNCVWATRDQQANNRRTNRLIAFAGRVQTVSQWARTVGIRVGTLFRRLDEYGWPVERALTTPVG